MSGFSHSQAQAVNQIIGAATSLSVVLTNNPAVGDVVCIGITWSDGTSNPPASISVADSAGNNYTKSTNSPLSGNAQNIYNYYLNNAPANANKTITATFSTTGAGGFAEITADDFAVSGGVSSFSQDATGNGTGTSVNTPTVPFTGSGGLEFFYVGAQNGVTSVDSPWTGTVTSTFHNATGYILNASGGNAVAATQNSGTWDAVGMSFAFTPTHIDHGTIYSNFKTSHRPRPFGPGNAK